MANSKKASLVDALTSSLQETSHFALVSYGKTAHKDLEAVRKELKKNDATLKVIKNTLFEKAVKKLATEKSEMKTIKEKMFPLKETTALLMLQGEWINGLKAFHKLSKTNEFLSFKMGYVDNQVYDTAQLEKLALLPGRQELMAKLIGSMKSPMSRTARAMKFNMQKLVFVLSQKSQQENG
ncbi:MAG: 50S ribosomal protein L10 [Weeksellaceae bacterium]